MYTNQQSNKGLTMIIYYIKNEFGHRTGVIVAVKRKDNTIGIGWSKCHTNKDSFNRNLGLKIAVGRANCDRPLKQPLPEIKAYIPYVYDRAQRYFKNLKFNSNVVDFFNKV